MQHRGKAPHINITSGTQRAQSLFASGLTQRCPLVYVSKENDILTSAGAEGAPDFVVEILSPKTAFLDKGTKRRVNARTGVKEFWIIDPQTKLIHVYFLQKNGDKPAFTYSEKDTFTSPHFPGLKFKGREIFKQP